MAKRIHALFICLLSVLFFLSAANPCLTDLSLSLTKAPRSDDDVSINSGFFVNVDLEQNYNSSSSDSDGSDIDTVQMMLGLYTSTSLLATACENLSVYNCDTYICSQYPNMSTAEAYPYFEAQGYPITTNLFLNDLYWNLKANATLATSCHSGGTYSFGSGSYGILGMGLSGNSWTNFIDAKFVFSIYFDQETGNGKLLFDNDATKSTSSAPLASFQADRDWHIANVNQVEVGALPIPINSNMIFDINANAMGFPLSIYDRILQGFNQSNLNIECPSSQETHFRPKCSYNGSIDDLPSILIFVGNELLTITPEMYLINSTNDDSTPKSITLDIKALDTNITTASSYVTPEFSNYIILGYNLMKYFYIVFDGSSYAQNNSLVKIYPVRYPINKSKTILYVFCGLSGALIILTIFCLVYFKYLKKRQDKVQPSDLQKNRVRSSTKAPLLSENDRQNLNFNSSLYPEQIYLEQDEYNSSLASSNDQEKLKEPFQEKIIVQGDGSKKVIDLRQSSQTNRTKWSSTNDRTSLGTEHSDTVLSKKEFNLSGTETIEEKNDSINWVIMSDTSERKEQNVED